MFVPEKEKGRTANQAPALTSNKKVHIFFTFPSPELLVQSL